MRVRGKLRMAGDAGAEGEREGQGKDEVRREQRVRVTWEAVR